MLFLAGTFAVALWVSVTVWLILTYRERDDDE